MQEQIVSDYDKASKAFDIILERWKATPKKFPYDNKRAIIPQNLIPDWIREDVDGLVFFYLCINLYMKGRINSVHAFKQMVKLRTDHPDYFDPFFAQHLTVEGFYPVLNEYFGINAKRSAIDWIENAKRIMRNWNGKASNILKGMHTYEEAKRRIINKRTKKAWKEASEVDDRGEGFSGHQEKMVSMLIYFLDWEGLLEVQFIYSTPADYQNFKFGLSVQAMVVISERNYIRAEKLSKPWRDITLRYLEENKNKVTPVELADALWVFPQRLCGDSPLTAFHEADYINGPDRKEVPNFLLPRFRESLKRTCLSCPIVKMCKLAIPAAPYYSRKDELQIPMGGYMYLWPRYPIEEHLHTFAIEYMQPTSPSHDPVEEQQALFNGSLPVQEKPEPEKAVVDQPEKKVSSGSGKQGLLF